MSHPFSGIHTCIECGDSFQEDVMKQDPETEEWYCLKDWHPEPAPDIVDFMASKEDR